MSTGTRYDRLPITELRLDPDNPRFVGSRDTSDLTTFLPWFEADADLISVASSIATNGYFEGEPLLVAPGKDGEPGLVVVEGNRRFAAVLLLHDPSLLPRSERLNELATEADLQSLATLPCAIYQHRDEILNYLGNRHIAGVREWKPLAKATYLKQLRDAMATAAGEAPSDKQLAKRIGSNAPTVRRLLNTLEAFNAVDLEEKDEGPFSVLGTALQYGNIADFVGIGATTSPEEIKIEPDALKELATWTLQPENTAKPRSAPRVNSRKLDDLNTVVANADALAAFRTGHSLDRALRLTGASAAALDDSLQEASGALDAAITHAQRLDGPPTSTQLAISKELIEAATTLDEELRERASNNAPADTA